MMDCATWIVAMNAWRSKLEVTYARYVYVVEPSREYIYAANPSLYARIPQCQQRTSQPTTNREEGKGRDTHEMNRAHLEYLP